MAHKKRKISDFTVEDSNRLMFALMAFQENLDETDEDLPPELLPAVQKLTEKLKVTQHILGELGIKLVPLSLRDEKVLEIRTLGGTETNGNWLTTDATKQLLSLIRSHVSMANEAGSRILINMFLLRLASVMGNKESEVNIIPEFPVVKTMLQGRSFGGVIDFLVTRSHSKYNDLLLETPVAALASETGVVKHANIIVAKRDHVKAALPQAAVAAASYCKQHGLTVLRGCITNGEQWAFFVYSTDTSSQAKLAVGKEISLGAGLEQLTLLLGLLHDMAEHSSEYEQAFFNVAE